MENDNPLLLGMDLPYSLEAEQSVLGAVLVEPGCLSELVERLRPDAFYRPQHKALFNEMVRMFTSGEPVDFITLLEAAKEAIEKTAERGITTGGHLIFGLPGENCDMMLKEKQERKMYLFRMATLLLNREIL
mgnify:CR=1 FL=1